MAYVPPHRRHSASSPKPVPVPESLVIPFKNKLNVQEKKKKKRETYGEMIVYADEAVTRWWIAGSAEDDRAYQTLRFEEARISLFEHEIDQKPFVLVKADQSIDKHEDAEVAAASSWMHIASKAHQDLIFSMNKFKSETLPQGVEFSPSLVLRVGKILFYGNSSFPAELENLKLDKWERTRRIFHTDLPAELIEDVVQSAVSKIGTYSFTEKEQYYVKVRDEAHPGVTYSCKCNVTKESEELKIHKIYLSQVRHMVANIASIDKDLDLRVMLARKQTYVNIPDEEVKEALLAIVTAATREPRTKGGLQWALGKGCYKRRFSVVGSWHAKHRKFKYGKLGMSLYARWADRYDFIMCKGGVSNEITLKMDQAREWMKEDTLKEDVISEKLKEAVRITREYLLNCRYPLH